MNVNTDVLIAYHDSVGTLKQIDIQDQKGFAIDASAGDVTILGVGKAINFVGVDSSLGFSNLTGAGAKNIKSADDLTAVGGNGGNLLFKGGATAIKALNIISDVANTARKLGNSGGNKLSNLAVAGYVTASSDIDFGALELDVANGANFVDLRATSAAIPMINIGVAVPELGIAADGPATHVIDVSTAAAVNLVGDNVKFKDAGSILKIQNTVGVNKTVTLTNNIVGGVGGAGNGGIVELNANNVGGVSKLTIAGGKTIGTQANPLQTLMFTGNGEIDLSPDGGTKFYATNLNLGGTAIKLGDIAQHLEFSGNTILTKTGNITSVDFKGFNATINMNNGTNITGTVTNTVAPPPTNNGTINFAGTGQIGGNISGLAMLKAGAGAVTLSAGGATKITEIQGTGTDTLTLGPDFNLTGAINSTGGLAVKLNFTNGGSVSPNIS